MIRLRLRGPGGLKNVAFESSATAAALLSEASQVAQSENGNIVILAGFPPAELKLDEADTRPLSALVQTGDTLTVKPATTAPPTTAPPATAPPALASTPAPAPVAPAPAPPPSDDDPELALALALSRGEVGAPAAPAAAVAAPAPPADGEDAVVRRVIPANNSCLFAALAYALEGGAASAQAKAPQLRELVAAAVRDGSAAGDDRYSEVMLGRPPDEYAAWILDAEHWGGATELDILSRHYATELCAIDVMSGRVDCFGQGAGHAQRAMLLYDGIHYDLLVRTLFDGAPEELDVTLFRPDDARALEQAKLVAAEARRNRTFTDTASFTLRCLVCQRGLKGQAEAVEHAQATGHANFSEYR